MKLTSLSARWLKNSAVPGLQHGCAIRRMPSRSTSSKPPFWRRFYHQSPDQEVAKEIGRYLVQGGAIHVEQFAQGRVGLVEYPVSLRPELAGRMLCELDVFHGLLVVAVSRDGEIIFPTAAPG